MPRNDLMKLMVTIVDRGKGRAAVDIYRAEQLHFDYLCMGFGTANSKMLDYFGLDATEKDMVLTLTPAFKVDELIKKVDARFGLSHPGKGMVFTIPLSGVSGQVHQVLFKKEHPTKEDKPVENTTKYDLILVVVNRGNLDVVMDAAREQGARGTVLHARRVGKEDGENLFGFTLQPEKEIIAILSPRTQKMDIMRAINKAAGLNTESRGILFSLPVEDMMGLQEAMEL